jgi:hypothetical protein
VLTSAVNSVNSEAKDTWHLVEIARCLQTVKLLLKPDNGKLPARGAI